MKEENVCGFCGAILNEDEVNYFDDTEMCDDCLDSHTVLCNDCGERIWRDDAEGDSNITLCHHCYEYDYSTCTDCGRLIHHDDTYYDDDSDYPYCYDCYQKLEESVIKSYNYKPEPTFYGSGNLFYGVELEIDKGGECNSNAEALLNIANRDESVLYAKHDGSIDDGFEMVSEPATLDYHLNKFRWADVFEKAVDMGYRSHNTSTCGLHVHVNRSAFGADSITQEIGIARVVHFVELHWNELIRFSRRSENNLNRWAARYCTISAEVQDTYKKAKDKRLGRYVAVNLENYNTIEFRMWRGTLRYKTFVATLQLVDEICNLAIKSSDKEIESMSWSDFVLQINSKPELIEYLKSKRLYVNAPIEEGVEQ